jgi:hypothetical protein
VTRKSVFRGKLMRDAHRHGLPVRVFVEAAIERFGSPDAAAFQLQVSVAELARYTSGAARFTSRLVELADARGMDIRPFVVATVTQHGRPVDAARALGVDVRCVYQQLWKAGVVTQSHAPSPAKAHLMQLLKDGVAPADAARIAGVSRSSAHYYHGKLAHMNAKMGRAA